MEHIKHYYAIRLCFIHINDEPFVLQQSPALFSFEDPPLSFTFAFRQGKYRSHGRVIL